MIRRYRERRQRQREEKRIVRNQMRMIPREEGRRTLWNPMGIIRHRRERLRIQEEEERTVRISKPRLRIRGVLRRTRHLPRLEYLAFLGIPYAIPPVDERRFQPPEELPELPPGLATPLLRASDGSHPCAQIDGDENRGSEDCLYLNIYTPGKPKDIRELLPVLVYIHGGGFSGGDNTTIDPDDIMREDLILVTVNYRLSIFGFLNMRAENCRGNAGLKDQVMALEWVRDNIKEFQGNPENVTICGQSAGATCVNLHMISPMSEGLFHRAIVMAGGAYCTWGFGGHAEHVKQIFTKAMGHPNELRKLVVDLLKRMETFELLKMGKGVVMKYTALTPRKMTVLYKPSIEYMDAKDTFLSDTVENLMATAKPVPTIAGITKQEGYQYFRVHKMAVKNLMKKKIKFVDLLKEIIQQNFAWKDPTAVERHFDFFKIKYFPEGLLDEAENVNAEDDTLVTEEEKLRREKEEKWREEEMKEGLATIVTDIYFRRFYDNFKIGNLLSDNNWPPFYVYEFDYFAGQSIFPMPTLKDDHHDHEQLIVTKAAEHGDDLVFLLGPEHLDNLLPYFPDEDDTVSLLEIEIERVKINMRNLWSSFCRTGIPKTRLAGDADINWIHHTEEFPHYLHIGKRLNLCKGRLNEERWSELNEICQLESTIPSLAVSPQTPDKESKKLQLSLPKLVPSTSRTRDPEGETFQNSPQPKPDDQSTLQTPIEEVEFECTRL